MDSPLWLSRVTDGMRFSIGRQNLLDVLKDVQQSEESLASGKRIRKLSDNPLSATRVLDLQRTISRTEGLQSNLQAAKRRLGHYDTVLSDFNDIVIRAKEIWVSQSGDPATAETRANAAVEVSNLLDQALSLANRSYEGRYIFSGAKVDTEPFTTVGDYILFQGGLEEWNVPIGSGQLFSSSVSAQEALGARSAEIKGRADLTPALNSSVRLSDLNDGRGVRLGRIIVSDGQNTTTVDLRGAIDLQDVIDRINESGVVTASLRPDRLGLRLESETGDVTVLNEEGSFTAADLGILKSVQGSPLDGDALNPILRLTTPLSDLRGGEGLDATGIVIRNGDTTVTVDFSEAETIGDVINAINRAGAYVQAEINEDKTGINLVSLLNGAEFTVEEAGGETAKQLGLLLEPEEIPLERLNRGFGVQVKYGPDFTITLHDGTTFSVDISGAETLGDVIERINNASGNGGKLVARFGPRVSIELEDKTTGSGELSVSPVRDSLAAKHLGIEGSTTDQVLQGSDLDPAGIRVDGLFNALAILRDALAGNDQSLLERAGEALEKAQQKLLAARADTGTRIRRIEMHESMLESEKIRFQEALGEERDIDIAEAVIEFQQKQLRLQAALGTIGVILRTSLLDFLR